MATRPNSTTKTTFGFPKAARPHQAHAPFGTRNPGPGADTGFGETSAPGEITQDPHPLSLCAALDKIAPGDGQPPSRSPEASGLHRPIDPPADDTERLAEAAVPPGEDSLADRIASRIGEIGEDAGGAPKPPLLGPLPEPSAVRQGPEVDDDPELIELLEQLNHTLDAAHAALNEGGPSPAGIAPAAVSRRPQRSTLLMAGGVALVALAAGLIYAAPWSTDNPPPAGEAWSRPAATGAPAKPTVTASRDGQAERKVAPARPRSLDRIGARPSPALATAPQDGPPAVASRPSPTFTVQPARGTAGQPIPITLSLSPEARGPDTSIMIQGVPDGARLSAGKKVRNDTWVLAGGAVDGLTLTLPDGTFAGRFTLEATLVTGNGAIPNARRLAVVVDPPKPPKPAAAPPPRETAPQPGQVPGHRAPAGGAQLTAEAESKLLSRGKGLLRDGDIASARLIFEHAAQLGSVRAMVALAQSYDPEHLSMLNIQGIQPDVKKAIAWYERASRSGDQQSRVRARALLARARR